MITAKWKMSPALFNKANASIVAGEIISIGDEVTPQDVVNKAMDVNTELHKCFEWNNDKAADKYRVIQARQILRSLVIERKEENKNIPPIRFFYKTEDSKGYKSISFVVQNPDEYEALLLRAYRELEAFKAKFSMLRELDSVFEAIDSLG